MIILHKTIFRKVVLAMPNKLDDIVSIYFMFCYEGLLIVMAWTVTLPVPSPDKRGGLVFTFELVNLNGKF